MVYLAITVIIGSGRFMTSVEFIVPVEFIVKFRLWIVLTFVSSTKLWNGE